MKKSMETAYDIIIVGTGAGAGTLAYALAATGKKILILERGGFLPREKENWEPGSVFLQKRYVTEEMWLDKEGKPFRPGMQYFVGGNTKVYGAALFRLRKEDFGEITHKGGISPAWPITYEEMQPYYMQAEMLYDVHGERGSDPTEPPEKEPYPHKPFLHEARIQQLFDGFKRQGRKPFPIPLGLRRNEQNLEKSQCIRCDTCDGFPCLVNAKADSHTTCINKAITHPNVTLLTHAKALRLIAEGRRIVAVEAEVEGKPTQLRADLFVVGCGAINSAALLLRSGVANSSGLVGKNYMCHTNSVVMAISNKQNLSKYEKTFAINDFYHGAPNWKYPLGHIQLLGNIKHDMLKGDAPPLTPAAVLRYMARHAVGWWLTSEDLPSQDNRVQIASDGTIQLCYTPNNLEGHGKLVKRLKRMLRRIDPLSVFFAKRMPLYAVAHQVGTCRFGTDPKNSVLDTNCKAHDHDNLYVVDGSFFPSSGAVNPGLTIIANALRVADHLSM